MEIAELYHLYLAHPSVQTDTRKLQPGDLFFALSGPNFNGNTFAAQALKQGAAHCIIDDATYRTDDRCIVVPNVLQTLQELALYHRRQFNIPFIAITGSNGKTTTKELVAAVLSTRYKTAATEGNLNNHIGIPLTLLKIKQPTEMAIIEMGANHQQEIAGYCTIALPTHGIITNCGKAHIEGFGGVEGVRKGKGELYDYLKTTGGTIFRNTDLDYLETMAQGIAEQVTFGSQAGMYTGTAVTNDVFLQVQLNITNPPTTLTTHLVGSYNFNNVMTAAAVGLHFGINPQQIANAIAAYNPDNSRSQWMKRGSNQLILDAYNANPTSMQAAITNFAALQLPNKELWIGGMKEMGIAEADEHQQLVQLIEKYDWKRVLLVGKEFKGISHSYLWFETATEALPYVADHLPNGSSILIKGSRGSKMETLLAALPTD